MDFGLNNIVDEEALLSFVISDKRDDFVKMVDNNFVKPITDTKVDELLSLIHYLDLTSLESTDNKESIKSLIEKATFKYHDLEYRVAGICSFTNLLPFIKEFNIHKNLKTIVVSAGFPSSQMPLNAKKEEVRYAIDNGADEIDICINRGMFLSGEEKGVANEIFEIKNLISKYSDSILLKVILEVGELNTLSNIMKASLIALENGADFIKTSTGKISQGADIYSVCVMLLALRKFYHNKGLLKGLKVSGGIRTYDEALQYRHLFNIFINEQIQDNTYFRIGCSRLFENIQEKILNIK
ncbi:MAG: deoxyribose-phosphate aldolase [Bacteroidales bacterium]|nr:deoxyribose-phosphate aldolase [Bacteroidales bacterium]